MLRVLEACQFRLFLFFTLVGLGHQHAHARQRKKNEKSGCENADRWLHKKNKEKQQPKTIPGFFVAVDGNDVWYGAVPATPKDCGASDAEALIFAVDVAQPQVHVRPDTLERLESEGAAEVLGVGA
uniref:Putative secreted protein n=1 Tax=Ixodes ricinus TaxID=34613 RepID=A0A6B0UPH7_IXORI